jgi:hypothetical protein
VSPAADVEALAANVVRLAVAPAACAELGQRARKYAERHDRRIHADHLEALLRRVVAEARGGR